MKMKLFPRNFVRVQEPPLLRVRERKDGAIVIDPPAIGGGGQTFETTQTATGSITKSNTDTAQGTSTNTSTASQTGALVLLDGGPSTFPVIREFVNGCSPRGYLKSTATKPDTFELAGSIPTGKFEESQNDVKLTGGAKLTEVQVIGDVVRPVLPSGDVSFVLPDLSRPLPEAGWGTASDDDNDDDGDEDDDPDSDNDNDSDDEPDTDDKPDWVGAIEYEAFRKGLTVRAPLSGGRKGTLDPNR